MGLSELASSVSSSISGAHASFKDSKKTSIMSLMILFSVGVNSLVGGRVPVCCGSKASKKDIERLKYYVRINYH